MLKTQRMIDLFRKLFKKDTIVDSMRDQFPMSELSPYRDMSRKLVFYNKDFKVLVNKIIRPKLFDFGFKGNGYRYYREHDEHYDSISLGTSKYGGAICINVEIRFKKPYSIVEFDITKIPNLFDSEAELRLSPDKFDNWWHFKDTEDDNLKVINEMWKLLEIKGFPFFEKFNNLNAYFSKIKPSDISKNSFFNDYGLIPYLPRVYYLLMVYNMLKGSKDQALRYAKRGLKSIKDTNDKYKIEFEKYINE
jgi:hypothetical protein